MPNAGALRRHGGPSTLFLRGCRSPKTYFSASNLVDGSWEGTVDHVAAQHLTPCTGSVGANIVRYWKGMAVWKSDTNHGLYIGLASTNTYNRTNVTAMVWAFPQTGVGSTTFIAALPMGAGATGKGYILQWNTSSAFKFYFSIGDNSGSWILASGDIPARLLGSGEPVLITGTYDGASVKIYGNDQLVGTTVDSSGIYWADGSGTGPSPATFYLNGYHDNTSGQPANAGYSACHTCGHTVFNRDLTQEEISGYYNWAMSSDSLTTALPTSATLVSATKVSTSVRKARSRKDFMGFFGQDKVLLHFKPGDSLANYGSIGGTGATATGTSIVAGIPGASVINSARYFAGDASNYLAIGTVFGIGNQHTFSWWVKFDDFTTGASSGVLYPFTQRETGSQDTFSFVYYTSAHANATYRECLGTSYFDGASNINKMSEKVYLQAGVWYHIVASVDLSNAGTTRFYVNGKQFGTQSFDGTTSGYSPSSTAIRMGYSDNAGAGAKMSVAEWTVINRMMTTREVLSYYNHCIDHAAVNTSSMRWPALAYPSGSVRRSTAMRSGTKEPLDFLGFFGANRVLFHYRHGMYLSNLGSSGGSASITGTSLSRGMIAGGPPARYFSGDTNNFLSMGNTFAILKQHTFSWWVKFHDFTTGAISGTTLVPFSHREGGANNDPFACYYYNSSYVVPGSRECFSLLYYSSGNHYKVSQPVYLQAEVWYYIVMVIDLENTGKTRFYVNGNQFLAQTDDLAASHNPSTNEALKMGYSSFVSGGAKMSVAEWTVINRHMTPYEVAAYYEHCTSYVNRKPAIWTPFTQPTTRAGRIFGPRGRRIVTPGNPKEFFGG